MSSCVSMPLAKLLSVANEAGFCDRQRRLDRRSAHVVGLELSDGAVCLIPARQCQIRQDSTTKERRLGRGEELEGDVADGQAQVGRVGQAD